MSINEIALPSYTLADARFRVRHGPAGRTHPMIAPQHLRKAPITEALIDFRIDRAPGVTPETFEAVRASVLDRFPLVEEKRGVQAKLEIQAGRLTADTRDLGFQGLHFKTADGRTIAQFRPDGFTLNRLKPYSSWDELFPEALRLWSLYRDSVAPQSVKRVALRYINHLTFPLESGEQLALYLTTPSPVPPDLPPRVSSFLTRVVIHDDQTPVSASVTQSMQPSTQSGLVTVLLDIDAFHAVELSPDPEALSPVFERLHTFKNRVFFSSLTERAIGLYE